MIGLVGFQIAGKNGFWNGACAIMLILDYRCILILNELLSLQSWRKCVVVALAEDLPIVARVLIFHVVHTVDGSRLGRICPGS